MNLQMAAFLIYRVEFANTLKLDDLLIFKHVIISKNKTIF